MNLLAKLERHTREYMILAISLTAVFGVFPFALMRVITRDWSIAALDIILLLSMLSLFIYVYKTRNTRFAGGILAGIFVVVEVATVTLKGPDQLVWVFPSTLGIYYLLRVSEALKLNFIALICVVLACYQVTSSQHMAAFLVCVVCTNFFIVLFAMQIKEQKEQLESKTLKDPLTGVSNRRAFDHFVATFDQEDKNSRHKISMLLIDINNYETLTKNHGHIAIDDAQVKLTTLIRTQLHHGEKIFRLGNDNYLIVPLELDQQSAFDFAQRLCKIIENARVSDCLGLKVSVGVAQYILGETAKSWFARTDSALHDVKQQAPLAQNTNVNNHQNIDG